MSVVVPVHRRLLQALQMFAGGAALIRQHGGHMGIEFGLLLAVVLLEQRTHRPQQGGKLVIVVRGDGVRHFHEEHAQVLVPLAQYRGQCLCARIVASLERWKYQLLLDRHVGINEAVTELLELCRSMLPVLLMDRSGSGIQQVFKLLVIVLQDLFYAGWHCLSRMRPARARSEVHDSGRA